MSRRVTRRQALAASAAYNRDGYTEHRCLECNRPVSKQIGGWRHHPRIWRNTKRPG